MLNTLSIDQILPNTLKNTLLVLMSSLAIALAAHVQIPLTPVPVTLQDFAVLLIAMLLGWRLASAAVLCYLIEGAMGLPVFANASGFAELIGPAGGYLLAFLPAAAITGYLIERGWGRHIWGIASAGLIGGLMKVKDSYNVDRLAMVGAEVALSYVHKMQRNGEKIKEDRRYLTEAI